MGYPVAGFPARIAIDDKCDACGDRGRQGIAWGAGKPVICIECLTDAQAAWNKIEEHLRSLMIDGQIRSVDNAGDTAGADDPEQERLGGDERQRRH